MKVKLLGFVQKLIDKGIDSFWERWLARRYDPQKTIVIAGTPRGGTTWVAEALAKASGHLLLHEPDHSHDFAITLATAPEMPLWVPLHPFRSGLGDPFHAASEFYVTTKYVLQEHFRRVISGEVPLSKYLPNKGLKRVTTKLLPNMFSFQRLIVKFVRANLFLHWILKDFKLKGTLIIRHPCAVVASQMHHKWGEGKEGWGGDRNLELIRSHRFPIYEQYDPSFAKVIRSVKTTEELLALEWCIQTIVPLRQPKPHPWFLTTYEDLMEKTEEWEELCNYLGCLVPPKNIITQLSSTYRTTSNKYSPGVSINKWRQYLSEKQIDDILRICSEMGVDFYDKTLYPKALDKYRQCSVASLRAPDEQNRTFQQSRNGNESATE
jgi:hypothetical protein